MTRIANLGHGLREEIDNLRRERVVFDQINAKLAFELHEKKKEMAQIIEISNIAYEARDQAQNEMALLKVCKRFLMKECSRLY
jgi:coiled-coil domain-containing protein 63/114